VQGAVVDAVPAHVTLVFGAPIRLIWVGAGLVGMSTVTALWLQVPYRTGGSLLRVFTRQMVRVAGGPVWGVVVVRMLVLAVCGLLLRAVLAGRLGPLGRLGRPGPLGRPGRLGPPGKLGRPGAACKIRRVASLALPALAALGLATWPLSGHPA